VALLASKCIENMELGHNITHGQWDWMNDPEIHSNTWEWDSAGLSSQWRYAHNYRHHVFTGCSSAEAWPFTAGRKPILFVRPA